MYVNTYTSALNLVAKKEMDFISISIFVANLFLLKFWPTKLFAKRGKAEIKEWKQSTGHAPLWRIEIGTVEQCQGKSKTKCEQNQTIFALLSF